MARPSESSAFNVSFVTVTSSASGICASIIEVIMPRLRKGPLKLRYPLRAAEESRQGNRVSAWLHQRIRRTCQI